MRICLCILLLGWVYIMESAIYKNMKRALEKSEGRLNVSNGETRQPSKRLRRYKRSDCVQGMFYDEEVKHCCKKCPAGQYVEKSCVPPGQDPVCKPCEEGTFLAHMNYVSECRRCISCDPDKEVEEVKCSDKTDAKCACKEGYYLQADQCAACTRCQNRSTIRNCSTTSDAQCGGCLPGFYEEHNGCTSCLQSGKQCAVTNGGCSPMCEPVVSTMSVPYLLILAVLLLLLPIGVFLIHKHKRKKKHNGELVLMVQEEGVGPELSDISPETRILFPETPAGHVPSVLQKSCALYDIIDCVPVRRWKEFMRTLELPDKVIEIVEVEISNFRDQQYEMLRRWCQLQMSSVDAVYRALERMNLSGCAAELRAKIESYS